MDEARKDFLAEMLNIGVGRAGSVVSEMVGTRVALDVPDVSVCETDNLGSSLDAFRDEELVTVTVPFTGILCGRAALLMTKFSAKMIVHRLLEQMGDEGDPDEFIADAMSEVGNIVLNSLVGAWSGVFNDPFDIGLPGHRVATGSEYLEYLRSGEAPGAKKQTYAVSAGAHFEVGDFFIMGTLLVFFDERSLGLLMGAGEEAGAE